MPLMSVLTWMGMSSISWTGLVWMPRSIVSLFMVFQGVALTSGSPWGLTVASGAMAIAMSLAALLVWRRHRRDAKEMPPTSVDGASPVPTP
jgi:hypothetical protein